MILRIKRSHLVLKTPLAVVRLLRLDVSDQRANIGRTDGKQSIPALPRETLNAQLLHPHRRSRLNLRHNSRRLTRGRQTQCHMNVVGHTASAETLAIQLTRRTRQVSMQSVRKIVRDQSLTIFRAENDMHQVEAQRLRHARDYMSGLQPSTSAAQCDLGLRPRLVCGRTFGPLNLAGHTFSQTGTANRGHHE